MSVELPKDADGREIPLDTKRLYDADGVPVSIRAFRYNPNEYFWRVERLDGLGAPKTTELRFTPPDSWEKLEEDLGRAAERKDITSQCRYFNTTNRCANCPIHNDFGGCTHKDERAFGDILNRIRKLRGDGE